MERPKVVIDVAVAGATCGRDLSAGGVFVPGCTLALHDECELVVRAPGGELVLDARTVFVDPSGAGLAVIGFGPKVKSSLAALLAVSALPTVPDQPALEPADPTAPDHLALEPIDLTAPDHLALEPVDLTAPDHPALAAPTGEVPELELEPGDSTEVDVGSAPEPDLDAPAADGADAPPPRSRTPTGSLPDDEERDPLAKNIYERLRGLTLVEQLKAAKSPDPSARMALERMYGKTVWEALLRNPRLTAPEVARIARMGALPRPMIELIVANGSWLQMGEVRRALLTNPRLGTDQILRVLRLLPKHELKVAGSTTAYPYAVRDAAKRLLKDS